MSITRLGIPGCSATPPDPITPIMQAAERLIRVQGGETEVAVYWPLVKERTGSQYLNRRLVDAARRDDERLVLSAILPKGKRPVAIERPTECTGKRTGGWAAGGEHYWRVYCCCTECICPSTEVFASRDDAKLAADWNQIKHIMNPED
jgi:hypothetical protein